jgi:hypothetical protein
VTSIKNKQEEEQKILNEKEKMIKDLQEKQSKWDENQKVAEEEIKVLIQQYENLREKKD